MGIAFYLFWYLNAVFCPITPETKFSGGAPLVTKQPSPAPDEQGMAETRQLRFPSTLKV